VGFSASEGWLCVAMGLRGSTFSGIVISLGKLRFKTLLTDRKACEAALKEVGAIFLATFFIDALMSKPSSKLAVKAKKRKEGKPEIEDLRSYVVDHMNTLTIILSKTNTFRKYLFDGMLPLWELPCDTVSTKRYTFRDLDFMTMDLKSLSKGRIYQCDMCTRFWSRGLLDFKTTTCRSCGAYTTSCNPDIPDLESGAIAQTSVSPPSSSTLLRPA
jgi:hypothetical protein